MFYLEIDITNKYNDKSTNSNYFQISYLKLVYKRLVKSSLFIDIKCFTYKIKVLSSKSSLRFFLVNLQGLFLKRRINHLFCVLPISQSNNKSLSTNVFALIDRLFLLFAQNGQ